MIIPRVIPCLLLRGNGLYKGQKFRNHRYVGDPINAVRIYNEMEVDELLFLDISATAEKRSPPLNLVQQIADECFMPFAVGGGVRSVEDARKILNSGAEKICIGTAAWETPGLVSEMASEFGSQSVMISIDVARKLFGSYEVTVRCGSRRTGMDPLEFARRMEDHGAGELLLTDISREGSMSGYNLDLISKITDDVSVPLIASGGAGTVVDFRRAVSEAKADAVAAGSMFVFHGPRRAVLISYPERKQLENLFFHRNTGG